MVTYEWDPAKAAANHRKHGVRFADARSVFADDGALTMDDDTPHEERCVIIGFDSYGRLLVVVFTWRDGETVRLISARRATRSEADMYNEEQ